jgi:hypothetical protein
MGMVVYPVPASNILNVVIKSDKPYKTRFVLIIALAKMVRKIDVNIFNGSNYFVVNLWALPSGEYFIRSNNPELNLNTKFIIGK